MFNLRPKPATRQVLKRECDGGSLDIAGRRLPLAIVEHGRAKKLTLRIDAGGQRIRVTVPPGVGRAEINRFISRHEDWLAERLVKLPDRKALEPGVKIPILGIAHRIVHVEGRRGATRIGYDEDGPVLMVFGDKPHLGRRIADFMKKQAKAEIESRVMRQAASIGGRVRSISYRDTSSRWGSCSTDGRLSFSWRIIMAPPCVVDYLVAHEVAHLKEMNHGPDFWRLCGELCPKTADCKAWLKRNGSILQAIPFDTTA